MRKQFTYAVAIAAAALMVGGGTAAAQQSPSTAQPTRQGTTHRAQTHARKTGSDQAFIKKAAEGGVAEVELGKLATQKASNSEVKQFGQRMVDDHSKANDQLKPIAQQENVQVPSQLTGKNKREYDRLSKLSGAQFDRAYMRLMVQDHRKDVNEFRRESKSAKNDQVKQFTESTLPTLQDHLKQAEQTAQTVGAATAATTGTKSSRRRATGTSGTTGRTGPTDTNPTGTRPAPGSGTTGGGSGVGTGGSSSGASGGSGGGR